MDKHTGDDVVATPPVTQNRRPAYLTLPPTPARDLRRRAQIKPLINGHTSISSTFRFVEPTWRNYIMYVDLEARTGNEDAIRYLNCWQGLRIRDRNHHVPEQICTLAKVSPVDLVGWVARQSFAEGNAKTNMCFSFKRDKVLEKTAEFGMASEDNYKDRELFLKSSGALPTPARSNGPLFLNMPIASSNSVSGVVSESAPVDRSGLRDMDAEISELSKIMQNGPSGQMTTLTDPDDDDDQDDDEDDEEDDGD